MAREKSIKVRVTDEEMRKVKRYAQSKSISIAELIRDYIKQMPEVPRTTLN